MEAALGLSGYGLLGAVLVVFAAAFIRGYSGFGFSAVLMAGLILQLPAVEIVPLSIALEVIASAGQARGIYRDINWRPLAALLLTGMIGTPFGVYLLGILPDAPLRISVQVLVLLASVFLVFSKERRNSTPLILFALVGFVAGVVNGATALSGLVLALFFTLSGEKAAVMRATMIAYFFVTDLWTGGLLIGAGLFDIQTVFRVIAALPLLGIGVWIGSKSFLSTNPASFRTYVLWLLMGLSSIGLLGVVSG